MKRKFTLIFLGISLLFTACDLDGNPISDDSCPSQLICTEEFRFLSYQAMHEGKPVVLDDYHVKNLDNGNIYESNSLDDQLDEGIYTIVTDAQLSEIEKTGTVLRFFGVKYGEIIIEQDFTVGHDCCHIIPIDGPFDSE